MPWRRYSNSRRSTLPGAIGSPGAMRSRAWMPVISSMEIVRWASSEVAAALYSAQMSAHLASKAGSGFGVSQ